MPKPLFLPRASRLYVRFKLPADIRAVVGIRFLVRTLGSLRGDEARLAAAHMGYALAEAFDRIRSGGASMGPKKELEAALAATISKVNRPYEINVPGVLSLKADGPEDHARLLETLSKMEVVLPGLPAVSRTLAAPTGPLLHASAQLFLQQFEASNRAPATLLETQHSVTLFCDLTDDMPLAEVGPEQVDGFREALNHWPPRARVLPGYKGLSARQIVAKAKKNGGGGLAIRTFDKHFDRLRTFFNWAVQRRQMPHNPLAGLRLQRTADKYTPKRRGFRPDELAKLFEPARRLRLCAADPLYFWVPVFGLFLGARLREVAQLLVTDLDEVAGVWGVHITPESTKSVKNRQSRRFVPLPERLLALGVLDYRADVKALGHSDLFPGGSVKAKNGPGDRLGKWFNRTLLRVSCGIEDPEVSFHSTRHNFLTAGDRLGFTEAQVGALTGHAAKSVQARHYIDAATVPERKERIDRIAGSYDLPELAPYRSGQFAAYFEDLRREAQHAAAADRRRARSGKAARS